MVGGGIAGLTAAWETARAGVPVRLYEASDRLGGAIAPHVLAGLEVDAGAEAFATRSAAVPQLIQELGLSDQVVEPNPDGAWLQLPDLASPLPATGILGIPGDPAAADVVAILGEEGARRAAEDLSRPLEGWGAAAEAGAGAAGVGAPSVGAVVRDRMGQTVLDRLVTPIVSGVHSAQADDLDMGNAAPGLFEAMCQEGSLARAVAKVRSSAPAGSAVNSLEGGLKTLVAALEQKLTELGVEIRTGTEVTNLGDLDAEHVILAVDGPRALGLAAPYADLPPQQAELGRGVSLVSMVLKAPELDARPRGTGMLVAPSVEGIGAKAMTHVSAKWDWASRALTQQLGEGHHLVRLSYGRVGDDPAAGALGFASSDEQLLQAAAADVGALFGLPIAGEQILDADVVRWQKALPQASAGHQQYVAQVREALAQGWSAQSRSGPRLYAVGSWFAGTGLARVIPDARAVAELITNDS
ncbi:protoporphyrinogen oxidase [Nesterenkonia cremea]|uniref:Protoporphyrinogen oxidase n=1 Tax=Nesterenkonia cremea TaxID=1882340 RepID=A0A917EQ85_9MICC|nr:protoporphyrinogen oxidase [Nesterenkonia cremea]